MKRIAGMREVAKIVRFGSVTPISGADFVREVSQAPEDVWVVVLHQYSDCQILLHCLDELTTKYPATKFVKIISTNCIQNYPDCNLPTVLVYHNDALKSNYVGVRSFGRRCTPEDPVLNDGRSKKEQSREAVLERVRERFLGKVVERVISSEIMFASFAVLEMAKNFLLLNLIAVVSFCFVVLAFEPSPLQDFCVADPASPVKVNGLACKDPKSVNAEDFYFSGLHLAGNTSNTIGSKVTAVNVAQVPGLNTLGISLARVDYAPWGINPPHTHPRATEILTVLEGSLQVGFVTSNPENRLITKVLNKGDVFVFPIGLVHYQRNVGYGNAVAIAALSSQNPGVISIANAVFGSEPAIETDILAKAFQIDESIAALIQSKF
ncbi:putative germin-like protein 2-1 [Capsicum annuum]|nr:putative germin-like protein 2-1 [Capsicum annuum]KAF3675963.1 putative germin-like protein 2-1 [Capsicum annuum]